jgi:hypothetical protein
MDNRDLASRWTNRAISSKMVNGMGEKEMLLILRSSTIAETIDEVRRRGRWRV